MRQLGSFFHVAMNGMAASDKIFRLIDLPEPEQKSGRILPESCGITIKNLRYSYEESREVLNGIDIKIPELSKKRENINFIARFDTAITNTVILIFNPVMFAVSELPLLMET